MKTLLLLLVTSLILAVMKPPFRHPRAWNQFYANSRGYFWLPCPICGKEFGGHEVDEGTAIVPSGRKRIFIMVCNLHTQEQADALWKAQKGFR